MSNKVKKIDPKKVAKESVSKQIKDFFESENIIVKDGADFGMTSGTLVLHMDKCDVQVKLITPKAGQDRYEEIKEEEETKEEEKIEETKAE